MAAVRWTGFLASSLGKLRAAGGETLDLWSFFSSSVRRGEGEIVSVQNLRLDLSLVAGGTLPGKVGQRTVAGSLELRVVSIVVARASTGGEFCVRTLR